MTNSNTWITVRQINGDEMYFDYIENLNVKNLINLLGDQNPNVSIKIINNLNVLKNDFIFDQNTKYNLDMVKKISLYSYHQKLYDLLYDKSIEVTESEIYYCYAVEYCRDMLTLKIKSFKYDDNDRHIVYHREFYYCKESTYLYFDRYHGEYGIIVDKFEEFGNSFDSEIRNFMDEVIRECSNEEKERDCNLKISFNMPDNRDEIINSMNIYVFNEFIDYDSNYGDSDNESDYSHHPYDY